LQKIEEEGKKLQGEIEIIEEEIKKKFRGEDTQKR